MSQHDETAPPARRRTKPVVRIAAALLLLALIAGAVGGIVAHADSSDTWAQSSISEPAATATAQRSTLTPAPVPKDAIPTVPVRRVPKNAAISSAPPSRTPRTTSADTAQKTHGFTSCNDVWAGGQGPFKKGEPGYAKQLDPDGDGIACPSKPKD